MKKTSPSIKAKSMIVALAAVVIAGGVGGAVSAQSNNGMDSMQMMGQGGMMHGQDWNNGKGGMQWDNHNDQSYREAQQQFDRQVRDSLNQAWAASNNQASHQALQKFYESYMMANQKFDMAMKGHDSSNMNHDQMADMFNRAKATYFGDLETAKNRLASDMDAAGQAKAKDVFMNHFNMAKDMYGNWLEQYKNKSENWY